MARFTIKDTVSFMLALIVIKALFTFIPLLLALVVFFGKGDSLIAGYNTANEKEKDKYHAERLRKLVGGVMFLVCAVMWLPDILGKPDSKQLYYVVTAIIVIAAIAVVVLANTWAKKK